MGEKNNCFVVAVSGGVDSCVLLHMLKSKSELLPPSLIKNTKIVVAHVDHGIRENSKRDRLFVEKLAKEYGFEFEYTDLSLGKDASENQARTKRYEFLEKVMKKHHAIGIITAHHGDDVLETAAINIIRGTGRKGLSSLKSSDLRIRPLLKLSKKQILDYAKDFGIKWNEDETNSEMKYLRNRIRRAFSSVESEKKEEFSDHLQKIAETNQYIDSQIMTLLRYRLKGKAVLSRSWFVKLDHTLAGEFMAAFLRLAKVQDIDSKLIERLVVSLKASKPGTKIDVDKNHVGLITKRSLRLVYRENLKTLSV